MIQTEAATDRTAMALACRESTSWFTSTQPRRVRVVFTVPPAAVAAEESFEKHFAKLPSLDQVKARLRARGAAFDAHLATARQERWQLLQGEVEAGRLSRLAAARIQSGLTQSELADRARMKQANISRLECGRTTMSVKTARKLAEALGVADYRELLP